jgi:hypothetical protein
MARKNKRLCIPRRLATIAPRYGYWPYLLPVQVKQATASLERNPIFDACGGKILTTPRVQRSPKLLEGLGYQGMRWSPIRTSWSVVHVRGGDGGAVSWTTRERSSALCITVPRVCSPAGPVSQAPEEPTMPQGLKIQTSRLTNAMQEPTTVGPPVGGFSVRMPSVEWLRIQRLILSRICMFARAVTLVLEILDRELAPSSRWQLAVVVLYCTSATSQSAVVYVPL